MFAKAKYPIALDIGSHAVKLVQFERKKKGLSLSRLGMASLASGAVVDGTVRDHEEVMRAVDELIAAERAKMKEVVVSVSGSAAVVSTLLVPTMKGASLDEAVDAEAVQILPLPAGGGPDHAPPPRENHRGRAGHGGISSRRRSAGGA